METKQFKFGGLEITMYKHSKHGWVTTPSGLAAAIGTSLRSIQRHLKRYGIIDSDRGLEDNDFSEQLLNATNLSRLNGSHSRRESKTVLTVKGMIFLTQLARTPVADKFRKEVLETIEGVEAMGHQSLKELQKAIEEMRGEIVELKAERKEDRELIEKLTDLVFIQQAKIDRFEQAEVYKQKAKVIRRSAAGKELAASKADKKAEQLLH